MKAVLLDKATLGKDVSLAEIKEQCELVTYDTTLQTQLKERISDADIIISNKVAIDKEAMASAKKLKLICIAATGYNNVDIAEAKRRNIVLANVKAYSTESVAQTVFGYILSVMNSMPKTASDIQNGLWQKSPVFTMLSHPFVELKGKNLGIIGYGAIGKRVAEIGRAFGMHILIAQSLRNTAQTDDRLSFEEVLSKSDILSVHLPLTEQTKNLIRTKELKMMKTSALLINAARGGIINEKDLHDALVNKDISFAATDVLTEEPPSKGNILFSAPNIIITPHIAWTSFEARQKLIAGIARNIRLYLSGRAAEIDLCK